MVLVYDKPVTLLIFYRLNSAIERGTKPDALGSKPYHWTRTLKAAMVKARRAWKYSQPRCITFFTWQTSVSIESTVPPASGPPIHRADTVSGWRDRPPQHGSRCHSRQSSVRRPVESAIERRYRCVNHNTVIQTFFVRFMRHAVAPLLR